MCTNIEMRAERLLEQPFRFFHHPDFDKPGMRQKILKDIPNREDFNKLKKKVHQLRSDSEKIAPEMRPCYEEPLLTREQEYHLFKKMNYFKYKAGKLMIGLNPKKVRSSRLEKIERYLEEASKVRNQIASSNFRLATQLLKKQPSFYRDRSLTDGLMSDAYFDVVKAVDYFNFNLGNKFSTYCTWVLQKNFSRDIKSQSKYQERFATGMDDPLNEVQGKDDGHQAELNYQNNQKLVSRLLKLLEKSDTNGDVKRQIYALEEWFGLKGKSHRTLDAISQDMEITKERVRQLKERGLQIIRQKVKELGITCEGLPHEELA